MNDQQLQNLLRRVEVPSDLQDSLMSIPESDAVDPERNGVTPSKLDDLKVNSIPNNYARLGFGLAICLSLWVLLFAFRGPSTGVNGTFSGVNGTFSQSKTDEPSNEGPDRLDSEELEIAAIQQQLEEIRNQRAAVETQLEALERKRKTLLSENTGSVPDRDDRPTLIRFAVAVAKLEWEGSSPEAEQVLVSIANQTNHPLASQQAKNALQRNY